MSEVAIPAEEKMRLERAVLAGEMIRCGGCSPLSGVSHASYEVGVRFIAAELKDL